MTTERYREQIKMMASSMDLDRNCEIPSMYCDEFKLAAAELLSGKFRLDTPNLKDEIRLLVDYMKIYDESEVKQIKAVTICERMVYQILRYYREDIEDDIQKEYNRSYGQYQAVHSDGDYLQRSL